MYKNVYATRRENLLAILESRFSGKKVLLAEAIDMKESSRLSRYLGEEKKNIGDTIARAIEKKLNLPDYWLDMPHFNDVVEKNFYKKYVIINSLTVNACCGRGEFIDFEEVAGGFAFRTEWLERIGVAKHKLEVIRATGDSMFPTIEDGDILLIDRDQTEIAVPYSKIYVVSYDNLIMVKRVSKEANKIILESDNPDKKTYKNITIEPDENNQILSTLRIIGRVIWTGGIL